MKIFYFRIFYWPSFKAILCIKENIWTDDEKIKRVLDSNDIFSPKKSFTIFLKWEKNDLVDTDEFFSMWKKKKRFVKMNLWAKILLGITGNSILVNLFFFGIIKLNNSKF